MSKIINKQDLIICGYTKFSDVSKDEISKTNENIDYINMKHNFKEQIEALFKINSKPWSMFTIIVSQFFVKKFNIKQNTN